MSIDLTPTIEAATASPHPLPPGVAASQPGSADLQEVPGVDDAAAAGDWGLFRRRCGYIDANKEIDRESAISLKRRFGLAYLGRRAQLLGGVYMRTRPSVFTPAFVERMAAENAGRRFKRYPWLEKLVQLQQQLDQDQYRTLMQEEAPPAGPGLRRHLHVVPSASSPA